jgi:lipoyl(octanoyl) transferase
VLSTRSAPQIGASTPESIGARARLPWQVLDLGLVPYGAALERQFAVLEERIRDRVPDTLILVEHPPVVTLGRGKTTANLRLTPEALRGQGIEFFEVSRGGDATYHAPGQLVGYPIFDLKQHGRDVLRFCRGVEAALIRALETFRLPAHAVSGKAGVWVGERKIASLGISLRRWVTFHGFAMNVAVDLAGFQVIRPCGEQPEIMTSVEALLGRRVPMGEVRRRVVTEFARVFRFGEQPAVSR